MKYFTAKGDSGTTTLFGCEQGDRVSKTDGVFELLGGLDELNSLVGLCRAITERAGFQRMDAEGRNEMLAALQKIQENLFIIQAEVAGAQHHLPHSNVQEMEAEIDKFAERFPPIKSFVIPGATELGARLDIARAEARRVERLYLCRRSLKDSKNTSAGVYLNRLSSLLYCLARLANYAQGAKETAPKYK